MILHEKSGLEIKLYFGQEDDLVAEVIDNTTSRGRTFRLFDGSYDEFKATITKLGQTPLPKYINREPVPEDEEDGQTIFAEMEGAVSKLLQLLVYTSANNP